MLSIAEAQSIVLQQARPLTLVTMPLTPAVLGRVLAENIVSDLDMPPHHSALMDGYAVRCADLAAGRRVFTVVEEVTAGSVPTVPLTEGQATRLMTGAPLPEGADAVVMMEHTRSSDGSRVEVNDVSLRAGQHVLPRGREITRGETVLTAGAVLRPPEVGLLAMVGRTAVSVYPAPRVAILATGNELVEPRQVPGPGQIRNSNGPMLCAIVGAAGGRPHDLGIAGDRLETLRPRVAEGLQADMLVLSGGVSTGIADLVPAALQEAGVQPHFHKVALRPASRFFSAPEAGPWFSACPAIPSAPWSVSRCSSVPPCGGWQATPTPVRSWSRLG